MSHGDSHVLWGLILSRETGTRRSVATREETRGARTCRSSRPGTWKFGDTKFRIGIGRKSVRRARARREGGQAVMSERHVFEERAFVSNFGQRESVGLIDVFVETSSFSVVRLVVRRKGFRQRSIWVSVGKDLSFKREFGVNKSLQVNLVS